MQFTTLGRVFEFGPVLDTWTSVGAPSISGRDELWPGAELGKPNHTQLLEWNWVRVFTSLYLHFLGL